MDGGAAASQQVQQAQQAQHWRERAAARQRYWSLSHGFQMGRKLATWGEQEEQGQADGQEAAAVTAGGEGLAPTPPRKTKGLAGEPGHGPLPSVLAVLSL